MISQNEQIDELKELIDELRPTDYSIIINKCKYKEYARTILWLILSFKEKNMKGIECPIVTTNELSNYMRYSMQRSRYVLQELVKLDLMMQIERGKRNEYRFVFGNGIPKIFEYADNCKQTLNLKLKIDDTKGL